MHPPVHPFCELFAQLGLPAGEADIERFIRRHAPLPGATRLDEAAFWSPAQARLLRELVAEDADWAELVDQLDLALRRR